MAIDTDFDNWLSRKFFEMVIYDEKFIPSDLTCEHVVEDVHNLIHCFQKGSSVVQLVTEHVE